MADYKRFVSYIYLYEQGVKSMNTGFVRVEKRGEQCSVNVSMKNMNTDPTAVFSVYMFVRRETQLLGIYLGDFSGNGRQGDFHGVMDAGNIQGSGYSLDHVSGMVIRTDQGKIYGTGWDDETLDVSRFVTAEEDLEAISEVEAPREDTPEIEIPRKDTPEIEVPQEDTPEMDVPQEDIRITAKSLGEEALVPDTPPQSVLMKIMDKGLRMYPFEDTQVSECVCMEPQDIGMLPMRYWILANNSFLLHGYYSYRHLIMAKMQDGSFMFGVPGVNYQREAFMAGMFGFNRFKPVRAGVSGDNEFGYWCMEIKD